MHTILLLLALAGQSRNPFAYKEPPPRPSHHVKKTATAPAVTARPVVIVTTPEVKIEQPPKQVTWRYLGGFGPDSIPLVAIKDNGDVMNVDVSFFVFSALRLGR